MNETINKIKQLLPDKPNTIHHDIEYVELVNQIKEVISKNEYCNEEFERELRQMYEEQ